MPVCTKNNIDFDISKAEKLLHGSLEVPPPSLLPAKRLQHRLCFRNERSLYKRQSSLSSKPIISIYAPQSHYAVYATDEWWSDTWDAMDYGRKFDFSRPFFEQFLELQRKVPRIALFNVNPYNSDYCQQSYNSKNCYLCTVVKDCEDSLYISHSNKVRDSLDCDYVQNVELCYDCLDSDKLYACIGCENCQNSHELFFCVDCIGSSNCVGCWGLRNQRFHIFNERYSQSDYEKKLTSLGLQKRSNFEHWSTQIRTRVYKESRRVNFNINVLDCLGNHLINAKNCFHCYDSFEIEECSYCTWIFESHHCADVYGMGTSEWVYESLGVENLHHGAFNTFVSDSGMSFYSDLCFYCRDIFGCVGLRRKNYCILNRQYSAEEYERLRQAIIEHMKKTGEWGSFFPAELSPFSYNESAAQERFPLTSEQAIASGYRWRDTDDREYQQQTYIVPDDSREVEDAITKQVLSCTESQQNFRITPQELVFYKKMALPIPIICPDARYQARMARRDK